MDFFNPFMNHKPYGTGYSVAEGPDRNKESILEMGVAEPSQILIVPERLSLHLLIEPQNYENETTCQVIKNEEHLDHTFLYKQGIIQEGPTRLLKRHSRHDQIKIINTGRGFYLDEHERWIPFYPESKIQKALKVAKGEALFEKKFGVRAQPFLQIIDMDKTNEIFYYPYGGYVPEKGEWDDVEQIFCNALVVSRGECEVSGLVLSPYSELEKKGIKEGMPLPIYNSRHIIKNEGREFPQTSLGQDVREGKITFRWEEEGDSYLFGSENYEMVGRGGIQALVHFKRL